MSRKTLTAAVVAATIAWSIGLSALIAPLAVRAATSGSLIKASLPAVYYVGADGKRYVFPNEKTYKTWYADFSTVQTITDAELATLAIGGNVTYKPGVRMVKITTDPKVYAVAKGGVLRWVTSEALAVSLYGASWNQMIDDVSDAFFTNYTVGSDITSASQYSPSGEQSQATSINSDKNLSGFGGSGAFSAMLSSNQPAGGTLPGGATSVNMLKLDVKNNGTSASTVTSLTVKRTGAGTTGDFAALYVYEGNNRLTTGRTLNATSHEATFSGLNVELAAGQTKTLWIAADMSANQGAGNTHSLSVVALMAGSTPASGLPVSGPTFTMASADVGTVTIARAGAQPLSNVKAGGSNQKIAEFQLTAGAAEDIDLNRIALFRGGAVSKQYVTNLTLKQAGSTVASTGGYDNNDRATFVLATPMLIEKGSSKTFEVYADIGAGSRVGATETILTYLDQTTDLLATGRTYGYGVQAGHLLGSEYDGATVACALGAGSCSSTRIEGGQLTITFNGPAAKDVATNGKDQEVYNFTLAAQSNLEIRNLRMQISSVAAGADNDSDRGDLVDTVAGLQGDGDDVANFTDIKVVDTASGAIVAGPRDLAVGAGHNDMLQALTFTEVINLSAGQARTFKVTLDVANNTNVDFLNDQVRVDLLQFAAADIRNLDNSTNVALTDIVPNAAVNGNPNTVKAPTLVVGVASTPVAQTYIQGTQGAALAGFTLQAGDAADIRVTQLTLQGQLDDVPGSGFVNGQETGGLNSVANLALTAKLWNGSTQIGDTENPSASTGVGLGGVLTFDNLNLTVPKGTTINLTVSGNLSNALNNLPDGIRWQIVEDAATTFAAGLAATDPDGNTVRAGAAAFAAGGTQTIDGPAMVVAGAGTLAVQLAPDDTESEAGNVIGGTSNAVLAKYKFSALNEELKLTKVRMTVATANTVSSLSLYDGSTLVGGPVSVNGAGQADFSSVNFVIPKDGNKTLTVKGNLTSVGSSGAASGTEATVTLHDGDEAAGFDGTFEARGTSSGSSTLINAADVTLDNTPAGDIAGRQKVARRTKPTVTLVALPTTALSNTTVVAMRFTVAADAAGDVAMKRISASITSSAAVGTTFTLEGLRRVGDGANLPATVTAAACAGGATCAVAVQLTSEEVVAAGTSRTYDLRVTVGGTAVGTGNTMTVNLLGDALLATGELTQSAAAPDLGIDALILPDNDDQRNFIWSDMSAAGHGDVITAGVADDADNVAAGATNDWTSGLNVKSLPSDGQTMSKS